MGNYCKYYLLFERMANQCATNKIEIKKEKEEEEEDVVTMGALRGMKERMV